MTRAGPRSRWGKANENDQISGKGINKQNGIKESGLGGGPADASTLVYLSSASHPCLLALVEWNCKDIVLSPQSREH